MAVPAPVRLVLGEEELLVERAVERGGRRGPRRRPGRRAAPRPGRRAHPGRPGRAAEPVAVRRRPGDRAAGRPRGGQGPGRGDRRAGRPTRPRASCWSSCTPAGRATRRWPTRCARPAAQSSPRATRSPGRGAGGLRARRGPPGRRARSRRPRSGVLLEAVGSDLRELAAADRPAGGRHRRHGRRGGGAPLPPGPGGGRPGSRWPTRWSPATGRARWRRCAGRSCSACRRCWSPTRWPTRCARWRRSARPAAATPTGWPARWACRRGRSARRSAQVRGWRPEALAEAFAAAAEVNADVKGVAADPGYALERAVLRMCAARDAADRHRPVGRTQTAPPRVRAAPRRGMGSGRECC